MKITKDPETYEHGNLEQKVSDTIDLMFDFFLLNQIRPTVALNAFIEIISRMVANEPNPEESVKHISIAIQRNVASKIHEQGE